MTTVVAKTPFDLFLERYTKDPVLFVAEVLGAKPDPWQLEVLRDYQRRARYISIVSGHGVGKTTVLAWIIIHHLCCRFPQKTVCTAPTSNQLFNALASEVKAWINKLPPKLRETVEVKSERIEIQAAAQESFVAFNTSRADTPEALAGIHSDWVLIIGDEASGIPEQVFEAAAGSMSGPNAITILAGNPVRSTGTFYQSHHKLKSDWATHHVTCVGNPRVATDFVEKMKRKYGEFSNAFRVRVLGLFPLADDDTIIPRELAESAGDRQVVAKMVRPVWGVDVARFGQDASALAKRRGNVLMQPVEWWRGYDIMQTAGRIKAEWDKTLPSDRPTEICVDAIGIGAGVADRLMEQGLPARAINVSESPALGERYRNLRTELWFKAKDWLFRRDCALGARTLNPDGSVVEEWTDHDLIEELTSVRFKYTSSGKMQAESKDEMRKRGVASPNLADAWILTLASDAVSALGDPINGVPPSWKQPLKRTIKGIV